MMQFSTQLIRPESGGDDEIRYETVGKRRATMNSRAAYDEEEALRRAIEGSRDEDEERRKAAEAAGPALDRVEPSVTDTSDDKPMFVNAKQFHRILKRRYARQQLEDKLGGIRPRGTDGRFLTTDKVEQMEQRALPREKVERMWDREYLPNLDRGHVHDSSTPRPQDVIMWSCNGKDPDHTSSAKPSEFENENKEKRRCPHPDCGKTFKDLEAHVFTHQAERPEKGPLSHSEYSQQSVTRKYDKDRHALTQYKGTMVCSFCPGSGSAAEKFQPL